MCAVYVTKVHLNLLHGFIMKMSEKSSLPNLFPTQFSRDPFNIEIPQAKLSSRLCNKMNLSQLFKLALEQKYFSAKSNPSN